MTSLLGLALAVAIAALVVWAAFRRSESSGPPTVLVEGTTWFVEEGELRGPCCEDCRVTLAVLPLPFDGKGTAQYELCCPHCARVPVRRSFTLLELLGLEQQAAHAWARQQAAAQFAPSARRR